MDLASALTLLHHEFQIPLCLRAEELLRKNPDTFTPELRDILLLGQSWSVPANPDGDDIILSSPRQHVIVDLFTDDARNSWGMVLFLTTDWPENTSEDDRSALLRRCMTRMDDGLGLSITQPMELPGLPFLAITVNNQTSLLHMLFPPDEIPDPDDPLTAQMVTQTISHLGLLKFFIPYLY